MKYSIVVVAYKAEDQLAKCLDSLERNPPPVRERSGGKSDAQVIIIDNSPDQLLGTKYNRLFTRLCQTYINVTTEWHPENLGFAAACNRGAQLSSGEILVFVNPDTEVFPEWAERMSGHIAPDIGGVGPISNFVAGFQNANNHMALTSDNEKNARYAIKGNNRRGVETKLLIGFFLMIPRTVWDKVGGMDPQFFLGCDDLDLSMRIRDLGYSLIIASDVFVYHEGHASFNAAGSISVDLNRQSEKRLLSKLKDKYGDNIPSSTELWGCEILPTYVPKRQTLSVCIIAVDGEENNLLELIPTLGFADEIVICNTGSDNFEGWLRTYQFMSGEKWGDRSKFEPCRTRWVDSFAEARNVSLSHCHSDWVLWLDCDDRVTPESAAKIRAAMDYPGPMTQAKTCHFGMVLRDDGPDGYSYAEGQPRLFPRVPSLEWEGRVHESYIPAAERLGIMKVDCDIVIDHTGYKDPELMLKKHARNLRLIKMEDDSPKKFYHMGKNLQALGEYGAAEKSYAVVLSDCWAAPLDKVFKDQVRTCMASLIIHTKGADPSVDQYLDDNDKPDALFLRAEVALKRGQVFEAEEMYLKYLSMDNIKDPHGSQKEYLQAVCRGRLELLKKAKESVNGL
jgi:GT2 family glycosyltransferase